MGRPDDSVTRALASLDEAGRLLSQDRNAVYGDALADFERIGQVWGALLGREPLAAHTVGAMLAGMKLVRGQISPGHGDSWVDAAAYCALAWGCV